MRLVTLGVLISLLAGSANGAPRQHTIVLGKWRNAEIRSESGTAQARKVRELVVDGRLRDYVSGAVHEVTETLFVVRRAYRMNDTLPDETGKPPQWIWRLGGWISVDRQTGHIAQLSLPAFDGDVSEASWYRDYAAYCGTSDDGSKAYMMVAQLGKRKPILKKETTAATCTAPRWERTPSRVTFVIAGEKTTFAIRGHGADLQPETAEEEGPQ
ncbi:MAG TPA: hypothetical protein VKH81_21095 [Candidatus Angelobacter sp.]|nr:hypothetical protein [Candidatus Angelobacter sp.]